MLESSLLVCQHIVQEVVHATVGCSTYPYVSIHAMRSQKDFLYSEVVFDQVWFQNALSALMLGVPWRERTVPAARQVRGARKANRRLRSQRHNNSKPDCERTTSTASKFSGFCPRHTKLTRCSSDSIELAQVWHYLTALCTLSK